MWGITRWCAIGAMAAMPAVAWALGNAALLLWEGVASAGTGWGALWGQAGDTALLADAMAFASAAVGACVALYLAVAALASVASCLRGAGPRCFGPRAWRAVLSTALGVSLGAGIALPAAADALPAPSPGWADAAPTSTPAAPVGHDGVSIGFAAVNEAPAPPTLAAEAPVSAQPQLVSLVPSTPLPDAPPSAYVVQPGDSLWLITAALLGDAATDADIAKAWPDLYQANLAAIGGDPDLIHPGLALTIPNGFGA